MKKNLEINWKSKPEKEDYACAEEYGLSLVARASDMFFRKHALIPHNRLEGFVTTN